MTNYKQMICIYVEDIVIQFAEYDRGEFVAESRYLSGDRHTNYYGERCQILREDDPYLMAEFTDGSTLLFLPRHLKPVPALTLLAEAGL
jgi:hypothetical protein